MKNLTKRYIEITQEDIDDGRKTYTNCDLCGIGRALSRVGLLWRGNLMGLIEWCVTDHRFGGIEEGHRNWQQDDLLDSFHRAILLGTAKPGYIVLDDATMTASYVNELLQVYISRQPHRQEATICA